VLCVCIPVIALDFFQSTPNSDPQAEGFSAENSDAQILQLEDSNDIPASPFLPRPFLPDAEAAAIIAEFSLQVSLCIFQRTAFVLPLCESAFRLFVCYFCPSLCCRLRKCCTNLCFHCHWENLQVPFYDAVLCGTICSNKRLCFSHVGARRIEAGVAGAAS
jgi:hypothetical protein